MSLTKCSKIPHILKGLSRVDPVLSRSVAHGGKKTDQTEDYGAVRNKNAPPVPPPKDPPKSTSAADVKEPKNKGSKTTDKDKKAPIKKTK